MLPDYILAQAQRYYGASDFTSWQTQDDCIYDEVFVPSAGGPGLQYFAIPAGGADPNRPAATILKTNEQTNIETSLAIGGASCFVVMSIHLGLYPAPKVRQQVAAVTTQTTFSADQLVASRWIENMSMKGVLTWEINKDTYMQQAKPFVRMPLGFGLGHVFPPVIGGVTAPIQGGANAYIRSSHYALFGMGDIFTLDQMLFLPPNTPFTFNVGFPEGNSIVTTGMYNGAGTTHTEIGTMLSYAELRGVRIRPQQ